MSSMQLVVSITEAAQSLQCCKATIYRLIQQGDLKRIGRKSVSRISLLRYVGCRESELMQVVGEYLRQEDDNVGQSSQVNCERGGTARQSKANRQLAENGSRKPPSNRETKSRGGRRAKSLASTSPDDPTRQADSDRRARVEADALAVFRRAAASD